MPGEAPFQSARLGVARHRLTALDRADEPHIHPVNTLQFGVSDI